VLGTPGQKLCENVDVHWLTPVTDDDNDAGNIMYCIHETAYRDKTRANIPSQMDALLFCCLSNPCM